MLSIRHQCTHALGRSNVGCSILPQYQIAWGINEDHMVRAHVTPEQVWDTRLKALQAYSKALMNKTLEILHLDPVRAYKLIAAARDALDD